jgi:hypothetical protein
LIDWLVFNANFSSISADEEDEDEERQPVCMLMFYSYIEVKN